MGAAITTLIGYIVTLVYRWIDTKKFVSIVLEKKQIFLMTLIVILQAVLYYIPGTASYIIRSRRCSCRCEFSGIYEYVGIDS